MMVTFHIKRIYDEASEKDGYRVLVDRLWPRGVSKERAALNEWNKDIAPSSYLRIWFDHKADRMEEFARLYAEELDKNPAVKTMKQLAKEHDSITLLYAAHDPKINHAVVLRDYLQ